ncbi:Oidioi.mRNA.OKI2018_I69.chr1.g1368.t1.cds [Oikopleura dioica]|uniref:Oidioi.mRNA.OKI2018_I69.chr1.g1368.t1.cds n=1 Tax=Oikopleura dioica TaxID=34765 RepID=A0ABN7SRY0_OIKDI|nr:Oidioi.mRNA.OKI2018_I69.chr1.g1368.t1.cds [Oikopleura dioica]
MILRFAFLVFAVFGYWRSHKHGDSTDRDHFHSLLQRTREWYTFRMLVNDLIDEDEWGIINNNLLMRK